jgi:hypothetical protein
MSASSRGAPMCSPQRSRPLREHLGWRRPLRHPEATPHQPHYAPLLNLSTVYKPQAIIDHEDDFVGSDHRGIGQNVCVTELGSDGGAGESIHAQTRLFSCSDSVQFHNNEPS